MLPGGCAWTLVPGVGSALDLCFGKPRRTSHTHRPSPLHRARPKNQQTGQFHAPGQPPGSAPLARISLHFKVRIGPSLCAMTSTPAYPATSVSATRMRCEIVSLACAAVSVSIVQQSCSCQTFDCPAVSASAFKTIKIDSGYPKQMNIDPRNHRSLKLPDCLKHPRMQTKPSNPLAHASPEIPCQTKNP